MLTSSLLKKLLKIGRIVLLFSLMAPEWKGMHSWEPLSSLRSYSTQKPSKFPSLGELYFVWCPSHRDVIGNELVDRLVVKARSQGVQREFKVLPTAIAKLVVQRSLILEERKKSSFSFKGSVYFSRVNPKLRIPWFYSGTFSRDAITLVNRIQASHLGTNEHLFRIGLFETPSCVCGNELQSINHIFWA